jgi:formate dehydrogenase major subunit
MGGVTMKISRRSFIKLTGASLAASTLDALGFGFAGQALAALVRPFKLTAATETRNTCTYCSVACGILIYSLGDRAKNATSDIIHIEGDPDHPVNRGTLCPKGSALLDVVHAPTRLKTPRYRAPGSSDFKEVTWDFALDRIAKLMKDDRDKNFIAKNAQGTTVNRWLTTGMLAASASSSETAYLTWKVARSFGMLVFDNQARV